MIQFLKNLFKQKSNNNNNKGNKSNVINCNYLTDYTITITDEIIKVEHPKRKTEQVKWSNIIEISLINTDAGPYAPDVFLALIGENDGCVLPIDLPEYNEIYDVISKYDNFNFLNVIESMGCTDNATFLLWKKT